MEITLHDLFLKYNENANKTDISYAYWEIHDFMESLMYEGEDKIREKRGYIPGSPFTHRYESVAISGNYLDNFETRLDEFLRRTCIKYELVCPPIHARNRFDNGSMTIGFEYDE